MLIVQVARPTTTDRPGTGCGLWQYFMCALWFHADGERLRQAIGLRVTTRPSIGNTGTTPAITSRMSRYSTGLQRQAEIESDDWLSVPMALEQPVTQESLTTWFREIVTLTPGVPGADLASVPDDVMFQELLRVRQALERYLEEIAVAAALGRSSAAMMPELGEQTAGTETG
eukprot:5402578-Amphidinium_carterae.1